MTQLSCAPLYLVPHCIQRSDGAGPATVLGEHAGKLLVVTLGIEEVLAQEKIEICVRGSENGMHWDRKPLLTFPQKSYCGVYATILNLSKHPEVRYLRVEWNMSRQADRDSNLMFGFYVSLEDSLTRECVSAA